jgi:Flp pilus assembly protein TadG
MTRSLSGRRAAVRRGKLAALVRSRRATTAVEFALCALAFVLIVVGSAEFGRLIWTFEVLQAAAAQGARCMGLLATSCSTTAGGAYSSANTTTYVVTQAADMGVTITDSMVTLNNAATCAGTSGFSTVTISYKFVTIAPLLLPSLGSSFTVPASACFPNHT